MLPGFLLPETTVDKNGSGEAIELADAAGKMILLSLGITDIVEQESLDVKISGSADGEAWDEEPVRVFAQKFYAGVYQILCDLSSRPETKFLRVDWQLARWGVGSKTPMFRIYVFAEVFEDSSASRKTA